MKIKKTIDHEHEQTATCQDCLKTFPETYLNLTDYEIDLCVSCENELLKKAHTDKNLKRRGEIIFSRLKEHLTEFNLNLITYDFNNFELFYSAINKYDQTPCLVKLDKYEQVYLKRSNSSFFEYYTSLKGVL